MDIIAVSVFVDWLSLSEANPNNNLMMRRAGLSRLVSMGSVVDVDDGGILFLEVETHLKFTLTVLTPLLAVHWEMTTSNKQIKR